MMAEHGGVALGIGAAIVVILLLLPALIVVLMFLLLFIYSIVQIWAEGASAAAAGVALIGLLGIVTALVLGLAGAPALIGRSLTPRKREGDELA